MIKNLTLIVFVFLSVQVWSQTANVGIQAETSDQPMIAPPLVNITGDSVAFTSELEKSNYLRLGLSFQGAYNDNVFSTPVAEGDAIYTISPNIAFDMNRPRLRWNLNYDPGFTFYQKFTAENQVDHVFSTNFDYELSPHVTMTLQDSLTKTPSFSGVLQQSVTTPGSSPVPQSPTFLVLGENTNTLVNTGGGQITYQFARDTMVGFSGNSSILRYLDNSVPGLFDSTERDAQAYYTHRFAGRHYFGVSYQFQDMVTDPIQIETQVHTGMLFYTLYLSRRVSFSLFGGAQHSDTEGGGFPTLISWSPTAGGGFNWQGLHNSLAANVSHRITAGGGLQSAVRAYVADVALRHQFTAYTLGTVEAAYSANNLLQPAGLSGFSNGHTLNLSASLQHTFGAHFTAQMGYTRMQQSYSFLVASQNRVNGDRGWAMISYQFERPLGR